MLVATPVEVMRTRLQGADFTATIPVGTGHGAGEVTSDRQVVFPGEWPGDALGLFVRWVAQYEAGLHPQIWGGTMIQREDMIAVGQMTLIPVPDDPGAVELGYGVNKSFQNRGYASEMAGALVTWALAQPRISRVTAACLTHNSASIRVLAKVGFRQIGYDRDPEGPLILWEHRGNI